jgi:hypothetical protein
VLRNLQLVAGVLVVAIFDGLGAVMRRVTHLLGHVIS